VQTRTVATDRPETWKDQIGRIKNETQLVRNKLDLGPFSSFEGQGLAGVTKECASICDAWYLCKQG
jgi:hypothetical protein